MINTFIKQSTLVPSMKNVLVLASTYPRWKNDTTPRFVHELTNRLNSKIRQMIVLAPHAPKAKKHEKMDKTIVHRFRYFIPDSLEKLAYGAGIIPNVKKSLLAKLQVPPFLKMYYLAALKLVKKYKPVLVHAHWIIPQGVIAYFLKKQFGIPYIVTIHGSDLFPLKNKLFKYLQKKVLENCEYCTVNSQATKKELTKRFPKLTKLIKIIPMGIDTQAFKKKTAKNSKNKNKNQKTILFVGRLNEQKGIIYLIRAMVAVTTKFPQAHLRIIGEGDYKKTLRKEVAKLHLGDYVTFHGSIAHTELARQYNQADVVVLPSITSKIGTEGQGLVLLEAMACGTPVVGTNSGGIPFMVKHRKTGLCVQERSPAALAKAILLVLSSKKLADTLTKNALQFVKKHYTWEAVVREFKKLYGTVLK